MRPARAWTADPPDFYRPEVAARSLPGAPVDMGRIVEVPVKYATEQRKRCPVAFFLVRKRLR